MANDYEVIQIFLTLSYYNNKFFMGCVNQIKGKKVKNADTGPHGILENSYYGIIDVREVQYNQ
jgi:hypothetical protein